MITHELSCSCGAFRASVRDVSPKSGCRVTCYCNDCQAAAAHLGAEEAILDEKGGTEIYQTLPAYCDIREGAGALRIMRLTPRGVLRWYTSCCNTPFCTTAPTRVMPIVGIAAPLKRSREPQRFDQDMGPSRGAFLAKEAWTPVQAPTVSLAHLMGSFLKRAARAKLNGVSGNPFFDAVGQPIAEVRSVTADERARADTILAEKSGLNGAAS